VRTSPGDGHHPILSLSVEILQVTEGSKRQEIALDVLHPRFDDPLLGCISWRAARVKLVVA
jgi:hypothetical protein